MVSSPLQEVQKPSGSQESKIPEESKVHEESKKCEVQIELIVIAPLEATPSPIKEEPNPIPGKDTPYSPINSPEEPYSPSEPLYLGGTPYATPRSSFSESELNTAKREVSVIFFTFT